MTHDSAPVSVIPGADALRDPVRVDAHAGSPRVAVLIVTWNRKDMVTRVLESLSRQRFPTSAMHVVVIDNASTDGTLEHLRATYRPESIVRNAAQVAHEPTFTVMPEAISAPNALGFGSFTVVRNENNFGGCGGFNTGFAIVDQVFAAKSSDRARKDPVDYVWLVDDDADVADDTLWHLERAMASDPSIGLVGSRTVDISDRRTTIETTIFFDRTGGNMCDAAPKGHPRYEEHLQWMRSLGWRDDFSREEKDAFGNPMRGVRLFAGVRDVDVVSACSMLARWSAVTRGTSERPPIGFWDKRYFIYCDDADWCLRFGNAGWRVVLSLDAMVFHTPWNLKLTPARIYYAQRNAIWMSQKVLEPSRLRFVTLRWMKNLLKDSLRAAFHRRLFHADIILKTAIDAATGVWGKTGSDGPAATSIMDALRSAGALRDARPAHVAIMITPSGTVQWGLDFIEHVRSSLANEAERGPQTPTFTFIVRHDAPGLDELERSRAHPLVVFGRSIKSRCKRMLTTAGMDFDAVVVFDQTNDLPLLRGRHNIHIDMKKPTVAQRERDGLGPRAAFLWRWLKAAPRCAWYALRIRPYVSTDRYG
jgi:GT2 family glycosyltransferase